MNCGQLKAVRTEFCSVVKQKIGSRPVPYQFLCSGFMNRNQSMRAVPDRRDAAGMVEMRMRDRRPCKGAPVKASQPQSRADDGISGIVQRRIDKDCCFTVVNKHHSGVIERPRITERHDIYGTHKADAYPQISFRQYLLLTAGSRLIQRPFVKSGNATGAPPMAQESSLSGVTAIQDAVS